MPNYIEPDEEVIRHVNLDIFRNKYGDYRKRKEEQDMGPVNVVYFTKEDGKNILLLSGRPRDITNIGLGFSKKDSPERKVCEAILGHKLSNLYALVDGVELDIMPYISTTYKDLHNNGIL